MSENTPQVTPNPNDTPGDQPGANDPVDEQPKVFDAEYVKKLREENAKWRTKAQENVDAAKRLSDIEESQKTEQQKLQDQLEAANGELDKYRTREARTKLVNEVAEASGVDAGLVADLRGESYEDLLAAAQKYKPLMIPSHRPDPGQGQDPGTPLNSDKLEDKLRRAVGAR